MQIILALLLIFVSCSGQQQTFPPNEHFVNNLKLEIEKNLAVGSKGKTRAEKQASSYLAASYFQQMGNTTEACKKYKELVEDRRFPLHKVAFVRSLQSCNFSEKTLVIYWKSADQKIPSWLRAEFVEVSLQQAKKIKNQQYIAYFSQELSKYKRLQSKKVSLLKQAIKCSTQEGDDGKVAQYEKLLCKIAPRLHPKINRDNIYSVARDYEKNREFTQARRIYEKIIDDKKSDIYTVIKAWNRIRISYKNERRKDLYIIKTEMMIEFLEDLLRETKNSSKGKLPAKFIKNKIVETTIKYARALWTQHKSKKAQRVLKKILKLPVTDNFFLAKINWLLGSILVEENRSKKALTYFKIASNFRIEDSGLEENIAWSLGFNLFQQKRYYQSALAFDDYIYKTEHLNVKRKFLYWQAKSLYKAHDPLPAHRIWGTLIKEDPYGYYGILSHLEMGVPLRPVQKKLPQLGIKHSEDLNTFNWLLFMDEKRLSISFLKDYQKRFTNSDDINLMLPLYAKAHWFEGGIKKFFTLQSSVRDTLLERHLHTVFPIPYKSLFIEAAHKYNVSQSLIYAITRQESAFNPYARSWADAFGLMQLTPETAKSVAKRHNIKFDKPEQLYDPKTNIFLGAALLKDLQKKFKNRFISYVASYNADAKVVAKWYKHRFDGDHIKFIEMIPYQETRNYIKLVFRNFINYKRMTSGKKFYITNDFFQKAL